MSRRVSIRPAWRAEMAALTMRNVSILSSCSTGSASTLSTLAYPPPGIRQCFSMAWKMFQPYRRYLGSLVSRYAMNNDSTVSGRRM